MRPARRPVLTPCLVVGLGHGRDNRGLRKGRTMSKQQETSAFDDYFQRGDGGTRWWTLVDATRVTVWCQPGGALWYWNLERGGQHTNCQSARTRAEAQREALSCAWRTPGLSAERVHSRMEHDRGVGSRAGVSGNQPAPPGEGRL